MFRGRRRQYFQTPTRTNDRRRSHQKGGQRLDRKTPSDRRVFCELMRSARPPRRSGAARRNTVQLGVFGVVFRYASFWLEKA